MKNGKEYCQSIRQQIVDLLEKAHLNIEERATVEKLDFGTNDISFGSPHSIRFF